MSVRTLNISSIKTSKKMAVKLVAAYHGLAKCSKSTPSEQKEAMS